MLCPNEREGCGTERFLAPRTDGVDERLELVGGTFLKGDLCNYKITNPSVSDLNDIMSLRIESFRKSSAVLIKGPSI